METLQEQETVATSKPPAVDSERQNTAQATHTICDLEAAHIELCKRWHTNPNSRSGM